MYEFWSTQSHLLWTLSTFLYPRINTNQKHKYTRILRNLYWVRVDCPLENAASFLTVAEQKNGPIRQPGTCWWKTGRWSLFVQMSISNWASSAETFSGRKGKEELYIHSTSRYSDYTWLRCTVVMEIGKFTENGRLFVFWYNKKCQYSNTITAIQCIHTCMNFPKVCSPWF